MTTRELLLQARSARTALLSADAALKNEALLSMAQALLDHTDAILAANAQDMAEARGKTTQVMLDRLALDPKRIQGMAEGVRQVAALPDPVGRTLSTVERPNGLTIRKVSVPMGVIAIIYESRPNVTSDAAALALKAGSACVLRGGKEAFRSANAIADALRDGLRKVGLPPELVTLVQDTSRQSAAELMTAVGLVDLLIPRGGGGLIQACVDNATVPCIQTGTGICHIYVDRDADLEMAAAIIHNAKTSRPSVCNAAEVCLIHRAVAPDFLPLLRRKLDKVELRLDGEAAQYISGSAAGVRDFDTEFLDYIMAVRIVDGVDEAIEHIARHSTGHSECIVTQDERTAEKFTTLVDSAAVYWNASTRFTDGGEFGLGCEMGISTQKLHARGPMGLEELTSYKYVITGNGQIR